MGKRVEKLYEAIKEALRENKKIKALVVGSKLLEQLKKTDGIIFADREMEIPVYLDTDFKPYQFEIEVEEDAET